WMIKKTSALCALIMSVMAAPAFAGNPKCDGPDNWAASMVYTDLKNAHVIVPDKIDFARTKVEDLAHQKIGKDSYGNDLYRQVFLVTYFEKSGKRIQAVAVS